MRSIVVRGAAALAACLALSAPAGAQTNPAGNMWARGTAVGLFGGTSANSSVMRSIVGGNASWEVTRLVTIEGRADWFDRKGNARAFGATMNALVNIMPRRTVTPFVGAGYGFHHVSFDMNVGGDIPTFYRRRLIQPTDPLGKQTRTFTDPAVSLVTGVDVFIANRRVSVRPEAGVLLVRAGGQTDTLGTVGVRVALRFESHKVTP